jgi:endogenous inhibitor of DNA gyrase (YacG/DUF329 family)
MLCKAKVICERCGIAFLAYAKREDLAKRRRFCDKCLEQRHKENALQVGRTKKKRKCGICDKEFTGSTSSKYCSTECKKAAQRERARRYRNKENPKTIKCLECGNVIVREPNNGATKFCSEKCRVRFRNRLLRKDKVDPKWLKRWGEKRTYIGKSDCFDGALV